MSRPALVLFDLDDVLAHYAHDVRVETLALRLGVAAADVEAQLFGSGLEYASDLGDFDVDGHVAELAARLDVAVTLEDCLAARGASMRADAQVVAAAHAVANVAAVAILTNNGLLVRDHLGAMCPSLFPLFSGRVYCSAQFRIGKPDPRIYAACLRELGVAAADVLFIDDKAANVDGARRAGLRAHHFTTPAALRGELRRLGLPTGETPTEIDP